MQYKHPAAQVVQEAAVVGMTVPVVLAILRLHLRHRVTTEERQLAHQVVQIMEPGEVEAQALLVVLVLVYLAVLEASV